MTSLAQYRAAEKALAMQHAAFEEMKQSPELKKLIEFDKALDRFLSEHGFTRPKLLSFLSEGEEEPVKPKKEKSGEKRRRVPEIKERTFINPHTQEQVTTKNWNHSVLRAWVAQYGKEEAYSWEQK